MKESNILQYKYVIQLITRSTACSIATGDEARSLPHFIPISVYARGDTATGFYQGIHEDTEMQLPEGKLYPAVRRVRGPSSIKEISARYSTYVLSYNMADDGVFEMGKLDLN